MCLVGFHTEANLRAEHKAHWERRVTWFQISSHWTALQEDEVGSSAESLHKALSTRELGLHSSPHLCATNEWHSTFHWISTCPLMQKRKKKSYLSYSISTCEFWINSEIGQYPSPVCLRLTCCKFAWDWGLSTSCLFLPFKNRMTALLSTYYTQGERISPFFLHICLP